LRTFAAKNSQAVENDREKFSVASNCRLLISPRNCALIASADCKRLLPPKKQTQSVASKRGVDLISDAPPFGRLWYGEPNAIANAIGYAKHRSRSHGAVIRVYDATGNVIEQHEHAGDFKEW
jgi:hypothetical protein